MTVVLPAGKFTKIGPFSSNRAFPHEIFNQVCE